MKTLAVRMDRHCANAVELADWLAKHPKVAKVYYPGLPDHPGHAVAAKQMRGFGGMISLQLERRRRRREAVPDAHASCSAWPRAWAASSRSSTTRRR